MDRIERLDLDRTAVMLCDMQNGFLHPKGSYARGGAASPNFAPAIVALKSVTDAMRAKGGWIAGSMFTLISDRQGEPFIAEHLKKLRPFLQRGDFAPGSFDQAIMDDFQPVHLPVEKVAYSAFYMSRLDFALQKAGITTLLMGGVVTNGGVASTVRDAHTRGYHAIVLEDGCAAFRTEVHKATIADLSNLTTVMSCADAVKLIQAS